MIVHITEQIIRPLIEAIPWIDTFGGVAQQVTRTVSTEPLVQVTYPVQVITPENCPPRHEPILTPDDSKVSVAWIEELGDAAGQLDPRFARRNVMNWATTIRFVCWLNGVRLGEDSHYFKGSPEQDVMKAMMIRLSSIDLVGDGAGDAIGLIKLKIIPLASHPKDPTVVFNPYTFRTDQRLFLKPFDFFGITFRVEWIADMSCPVYTPAPPIDCIDPLPFWLGGLMIGHDTTSGGEDANPVDTGVTIEYEGEIKPIFALNVRIGGGFDFNIEQFSLHNHIIIDLAAYHYDGVTKTVACKTGYPKASIVPKEHGLLSSTGEKDFVTYQPFSDVDVAQVHINILFIEKTILPS